MLKNVCEYWTGGTVVGKEGRSKIAAPNSNSLTIVLVFAILFCVMQSNENYDEYCPIC